MFMYKLLLLLIMVVTLALLYTMNPKRQAMKAFIGIVQDFIVNYELFKDILDKDLDCEGIKKFLECDQDEDCQNLEVFYLTFGVLRNMAFSNTKEMRQCFLKSGECALIYEEILKKEYGCMCDPNGAYAVFLEILQKVRAACVARQENTTVCLA